MFCFVFPFYYTWFLWLFKLQFFLQKSVISKILKITIAVFFFFFCYISAFICYPFSCEFRCLPTWDHSVYVFFFFIRSICSIIVLNRVIEFKYLFIGWMLNVSCPKRFKYILLYVSNRPIKMETFYQNVVSTSVLYDRFSFLVF